MAQISDKRIVRELVTRAAFATFIGDKAQELGIIDFSPDRVEVFDNGDPGFEIVFELDLP